MIDMARIQPRTNFERIFTTGLTLLGVDNQEDTGSPLKAAGIKIRREVLQVPARQVSIPRIMYRESKTIDPTSQRWNLEDVKFYDTMVKFDGKILVLAPYYFQSASDTSQPASDTAKQLFEGMRGLGIDFNGRDFGNVVRVDTIDLQNIAQSLITQLSKARVGWRFNSNEKNLVIFINDTTVKEQAKAFDHFKRVVEQQFGYHSLCLSQQAIYKCKQKQQYMGNVAMKVNIRLGNTNHVIVPRAELNDPSLKRLFDGNQLDTIILGADVTHTQKDSAESSRSLAALVGSVDDTFGQFYESMRYQERNKEIIQDVYEMTKQRLEAFFNHPEGHARKPRNRLPKRILYYRDGVDNGQYYAVRKDEVQNIKRAWFDLVKEKKLTETYNEEPKVTAVVVTKRHRTRFYPERVPAVISRENQNCKQGTCVDSGVTHTTFFDFFLQSHKPPPKGTAKPTYYVVLENGMNFTPNELQVFTNWLCYTYVRATLPVGYAPPTYYADRLCDRARCYFSDYLKPQAGKRDAGKRGSELWDERWNDNGGNTHGPWDTKLNDTMFWM
ncbi:hypothetical protein N0V83_001450 [Neocucurbitaria cava]|uniref:Piwi domain-containing protein n=1 Tax=Neocucurbitaria cava TaxID=798079 RepID=A0A9W8YH64_9PLEO|nr:hypothetical protein N0V83_001450 [Neocucurbitaria cava]